MRANGKYRVGDLLVDVAARQVTRDGEQISLSDLSWRVMKALLERAPATVGYDELATTAWQQTQVSPDTMTQRIKLLRRVLNDDPAAPRYIATERGVGYRLVADMALISEKPQPKSNQRLILIGCAAAILAVTLLIVWQPDKTNPPDQQPTDMTAAISADDLIESGLQYLSRGSYDDNERALSLFEQARAKDPNNAAAIVGLSFSHSHRATKYDFDVASSREAEALARQALTMEPEGARAWHALGFSLDGQGRVGEALRAYEQAIAIDPDDFGAISSAAYLLQVQGRLHEALLLENEILTRSKPTWFTPIQIASTLRLAGLDDAAQTWLSRAQTLTPNNILLAYTKTEFLLAQQNYDDAAATSRESASQGRASLKALYGEALLALGNAGDAQAAFDRALALDNNNINGAFEKAALEIFTSDKHAAIDDHPLIVGLRATREAGDQWPSMSVGGAYLYAAADDADGAASLLREAQRWGYRDARRLRASPFFSNIQNRPAFQSVLADIENDVDVQRSLIENDQRLEQMLVAIP